MKWEIFTLAALGLIVVCGIYIGAHMAVSQCNTMINEEFPTMSTDVNIYIPFILNETIKAPFNIQNENYTPKQE